MTEPAAPPPGLFDEVLARGPVREAVGDRAWLQAMLDAEAALARAHARAGTIPMADAEAIGLACRAELFDVPALARAAASTGNPVPALVRALTAAVGGRASGHVHRGATSQDILDSAAMLVTHRALGPLLADLEASADQAARLADAHRATPMAGRTLLQQALPITFGLKAAGWLVGLDEAADRLASVRRERLAAQLGGAAGTLASLDDRGLAVLAFFADELGLAAPVVPWHTNRTRIAEIAGALCGAAGALAKPARDVTLLAQTEVAEVREGSSRGGSSALPQKHNPVAAVSAVACAVRAPGLGSTLFVAMAQEHERAAGAWPAEWPTLSELLGAVGSAAAWLRDCLEGLHVDVARMQANLERTGGLLLAERVAASLAPALGRLAAHDLVAEACAETVATGRPVPDTLLDRAAVRDHLGREAIDRLLDPSTYLGSTEALIDRALGAHARRRAAAQGS